MQGNKALRILAKLVKSGLMVSDDVYIFDMYPFYDHIILSLVVAIVMIMNCYYQYDLIWLKTDGK